MTGDGLESAARPAGAAHPHWSSRIGFLLAAVGAAVGLGSVWKFPYIVGTNGGGAFVLVYLLVSAAVTLPILIGELMLGRMGQASPPTTMGSLAARAGAAAAWRWAGWFMILAIFLILTFYSVIGGWVLAYIVKTGSGTFTGASVEQVEATFRTLRGDFWLVAFWHGLFMAVSIALVVGGVQKGLERASKIMMPALFLMLVVLIFYAAYVGDFAAGARFLFQPDFSRITAETVLTAVGLSFFSIGTGMAIMMTYGSYLPTTSLLPKSATLIALSVPVASLGAGLAIFPLVFATGVDPASGPGLLFVILPWAFGQMPFGALFGCLFFILVTFAAVTSSMATIEPFVAWARERNRMSRTGAAMAFGIAAWLLGLGTIWSFGAGAEVHPLAGLGRYGAMNFFDLLDFLTSNIMLLLANIALCLFVGWILPTALVRQQADLEGTLFGLWRFALRFIAPLVVATLLVMGL